jgi:L-2-hydroxyglutarate oxidase LhgO
VKNRRYDVVVIGGGIIGAATALEMTRRLPELRVLIVEKEQKIATQQTRNNSGVIHSGLYYRPGSMKAKLCVRGAAAMIAFCREHAIPHSICGKVVIATNEQELPALDRLYWQGLANGIADLRMIGRDRILELEPHATGIRAIHVPTCGITDFELVTQKYAALIEQAGGEIKTGAKVIGLARDDGVVVQTTAGDFAARYVINCAGLYSDVVSRMAGVKLDLQIVPFRGEYYEIVPQKRYLVRGLIYPLPDPRFPFLGVHFTPRIHGGVEAGPNAVLALKREGYSKTSFDLADAFSILTYPGTWKLALKYWRAGAGEYYRSLWKPAFLRALQKLLPELQSEDIHAAGAGVRAMPLSREGKLADDFRFEQTERVIHVCSVPSPAATASLAIAEEIVDKVQKSFGLLPVHANHLAVLHKSY